MSRKEMENEQKQQTSNFGVVQYTVVMICLTCLVSYLLLPTCHLLLQNFQKFAVFCIFCIFFHKILFPTAFAVRKCYSKEKKKRGINLDNPWIKFFLYIYEDIENYIEICLFNSTGNNCSYKTDDIIIAT